MITLEKNVIVKKKIQKGVKGGHFFIRLADIQPRDSFHDVFFVFLSESKRT